jgi:hypothetical protein
LVLHKHGALLLSLGSRLENINLTSSGILLGMSNLNLLSQWIKISKLIFWPLGAHEFFQLSDVILVGFFSIANLIVFELVFQVIDIHIVLLVNFGDRAFLGLLLAILALYVDMGLSLLVEVLSGSTPLVFGRLIRVIDVSKLSNVRGI